MSEAQNKLEPPPTKRPGIVENIDPDDPEFKAVPNIFVKEHIARYKYVHEFVKSSFPELLSHKLSILDVSSGRGYGSDILKNEFGNANVIGVEFRREYSIKAQEKYSKGEEDPSFLQADARMIPLKDSSMDIVATFETIEHLPKKDQPLFVKEIARVLKPGGIAFISFPPRASFEENKKGELVRVFGQMNNPYHLYEPLPNEVDGYVADSGLETLGKFGQIFHSEKNMNIAKQVSKIIPIWGIFTWGPWKDASVKAVPEGKVCNTNIYVVKKPSE